VTSGEHVLKVSGAFRRTFRTMRSTVFQPRAERELVHRLLVTGSGEIEGHVDPAPAPAADEDSDRTVTVSGALVRGGVAPDFGPSPVLIRRRARYAVVLGRAPGQREGVPTPPSAPAWMAEWNLSDRLYEHTCAFQAVWVIETWATPPTRRIRLADAAEVEAALDDREAIEAWCEEILAQANVPSSCRELWALYVVRARELTR
jgi:hypothetical protein